MFRRFTAVLLLVVMVVSCLSQGVMASTQNDAQVKKFKDVSSSHFAVGAIEKWAEKGIVTGYEDGNFMPEKGITRAEFCTIINRFFGFSKNSESGFDDVQAGKWYAEEILKGKEAGYIKGYPGNTFKPEDAVSRQDSLVILSNVFSLVLSSNTKDDLKFTDVKDIAVYAKSAINTFVQKGYLKGYENNSFLPLKPITRAEVVSLLSRITVELFNKAGNYANTTLNGNVVVSTSETALSNIVIEGNLYLTEGLGLGNIKLENVTVKGKTFINGGGASGILISNSSLGEIVVNNKNGNTDVEFAGKSNATKLVLQTKTDVKLTEGSTLKNLIVAADAKGSIINGKGIISAYEVNADNVVINGAAIPKGTMVAFDDTVIPGAGGSTPTPTFTPTSIPSVLSSANGGSNNSNASTPASVPTATQKVTAASTATTTPTAVETATPTVTLEPTATPVPLWTMVWNDEFDGNAIDTNKWNFVNANGGFGNNELQYYTNRQENARVENGDLIIEARKESYGGNDYTSAKLTTENKGDWTYGRFEVKAKLPEGKGIWPAIWMMPTDYKLYGEWPACGEIDIMELLGHDPGRAYGTAHFGNPHDSSGSSIVLPDEKKFSEDYHVFALEWEPGELRWYMDGQLYYTANSWFSKNDNEGDDYTYPAPFDRNFFMQLNLAVGGNWPGNPDDTTVFSQKMFVDYVRAYTLTGRPYRQPGKCPPPTEVSGLPARSAMPDGNLIYNGSFDQPVINGQDSIEGVDNSAYWTLAALPDFGGSAVASNDNGAIKVDITKPANVTYSVQLMQKPLNLESGQYYRVSFDAKSSVGRAMEVKLSSGGVGGWKDYAAKSDVLLTNTMKNYSFDFQMRGAPNTQARIEFNMGAAGVNSVWIDNVRVEKVAMDPNAARKPLPNGNLIYNGTFDQGADRMVFWQSAVNDGVKASVTVGSEIPDRMLKVDSDDSNYGTSTDSIQVFQKGFALENGKTYTVTFDAKASAARTVVADVYGTGGDYSTPQTINITDTMQSYAYDFTMNAATDRQSQLIFKLGGNSNDVYLDNVKIVEKTAIAPKPINGEMLTNGSFGYGFQGWGSWTGNGGVVTVAVEKDELKASVGAEGGANWSNQITQNDLNIENGKTYILTFKAKSSVARTIQVMAEKNGGDYAKYSGMLDSNLTDVMQTFTYEFTMQYPTDSAAHLVFALGKVGEGVNVPHDVYIDDVSLKEKGVLIKDTMDNNANSWQLYTNDGSDAAISFVDGKMKVGFTAYDGWFTYSTQGFKDGIALEAGKSYILTFDASATYAKDILVSIEKASDYGVKYLETKTVSLAAEMTTYSYKFTVGAAEANAKLIFQMGSDNASDPHFAGQSVFIDNVSLVADTTPPPVQEGHAVLNGTFDSNIDNWQTYTGDGSDASFSTEDGQLKVAFTNYDGWFTWSTQLSQDHLKLEAGKTYTLSFDISATEAKDIMVDVENGLDYNVKYLAAQTLTADIISKTVAYDFTMGGTTDQNGKIVFFLGSNNANGPHFNGQSILLDNISLTSK